MQKAKPFVAKPFVKQSPRFTRAARSVVGRRKTLVLLRWLALLAQLLVILGAVLLELVLPIQALGAIVFVGVVIALLVSIFGRGHWQEEASARWLFAWDLLQLALLLGVTGGLDNPFVVMLAVPVVLGAALFSLTSFFSVLSLALALLLGLAVFSLPLDWASGFYPEKSLRLLAQLVAFGLFLLFTSLSLAVLLREREKLAKALALSAESAAGEEQLARLGLLAAAVAHELATPLSTITLIAAEMERTLKEDTAEKKGATGEGLREDLALLREQAGVAAGLLASLGEDPEKQSPFPAANRLSPSGLLRLAAEPFERAKIVLELREETTEEVKLLPEPLFLHALKLLLQNAFSFATHEVRVTIGQEAAELIFTIEDDGPGFSPLVFGRLGEPYVTTGKTGRRGEEEPRGLGLFIARTLLVRLGGRLDLMNRDVGGARVEVRVPHQALELRD